LLSVTETPGAFCSPRQANFKTAKKKDINQDLDERELSLKKGTSSASEAPITPKATKEQNQPS